MKLSAVNTSLVFLSIAKFNNPLPWYVPVLNFLAFNKCLLGINSIPSFSPTTLLLILDCIKSIKLEYPVFFFKTSLFPVMNEPNAETSEDATWAGKSNLSKNIFNIFSCLLSPPPFISDIRSPYNSLEPNISWKFCNKPKKSKWLFISGAKENPFLYCPSNIFLSWGNISKYLFAVLLITGISNIEPFWSTNIPNPFLTVFWDIDIAFIKL